MSSYTQRTQYAGTLREEQIGQIITLNGWVNGRRDLGGLIFIDVRDYTGITQVVFSPQVAPELMDQASELRDEFVIAITGEVRKRERPNDELPTGQVEVYATKLNILNRSEVPPFEIGDRSRSSEELRLKHRYLELRNPELQRALRLRNQVYQIVHHYYSENNFIEVETPLLIRSTPEGARDYIVPSRVHQGQFYALPQSPQIYKQILMIAGYDRYVQIAKCLRDEDLRADRQPEFTQIDLEMSFVEQEDVLQMTEGLIAQIWKEVKGIEIELPLPRMTYQEAMSRFGADKPDTRFGLELQEISDLFGETEFGVFSGALGSGGSICGLNFKGGAGYSRKLIDELTEHVKRYGAKGLVWLKVSPEGLEGGSAKFLKDDETTGLIERFEAEEGDMLLIVAANKETCQRSLGALRLEIARRENLIPEDQDDMLFVVDFPMFAELDPETNTPVPAHHPFTSYRAEDESLLDTEPMNVRANAYDLVINGYECAGGSIRIHDQGIQKRIFDLIGLTEEEAREKFGFLLDALQYGAPPHGGIAFGLDRLIMILASTDNIRDVIAFPKTTRAASLMDNAPSEVDSRQLVELGIGLLKKAKEES